MVSVITVRMAEWSFEEALDNLKWKSLVLRYEIYVVNRMSGIVMILSVHVVIDQQIPAATSYLQTTANPTLTRNRLYAI